MMNPEARELLDQYLSTWKVFTEDHGNADYAQLPGLVVRWTGSAFPFWNMIFLDEANVGADLLESRLRQAGAYMRGHSGVGFTNIFAEQLDADALRDLPEIATRAGLAFGLYQHAMAGDILPLPDPSHSALRFVRVRTDEQLQAYADLNSLGYGFDLEMGRAGLRGSTLWKSDRMHAWLALEAGKPVACAATIEDQRNLFLALVATAPASQRKGYGEAVVRKALHEGGKATGLKRATLHATDAGFPVYQRVGYRKVGTIHSYSLAE
jgi:ribosomal protein S18 acetylase RimI-like enzyme